MIEDQPRNRNRWSRLKFSRVARGYPIGRPVACPVRCNEDHHMAERGSCGSSKLKHTLVSTALVVYVIHRSLERDGYGPTRTSGENGRKVAGALSFLLTWKQAPECKATSARFFNSCFNKANRPKEHREREHVLEGSYGADPRTRDSVGSNQTVGSDTHVHT